MSANQPEALKVLMAQGVNRRCANLLVQWGIRSVFDLENIDLAELYIGYRLSRDVIHLNQLESIPKITKIPNPFVPKHSIWYGTRGFGRLSIRHMAQIFAKNGIYFTDCMNYLPVALRHLVSPYNSSV